MYCLTCGEEIPSHSAFCLYCGSKVAARRSVQWPTNAALSPAIAGGRARKIVVFAVLGALCLVVGTYLYILYSAIGPYSERYAESSLSGSGQQQQAGNDSAAAPSESAALVGAAQPSAGRPVKAPSNSAVAASSANVPAIEASAAQLNPAASHDHARTVEPAPAPLVETAPAPAVEPVPRRLAPKPKQVEETFYITRTGKRYHRAGCSSLRYSAFPITRAEAEAQGYTPCHVCYP